MDIQNSNGKHIQGKIRVKLNILLLILSLYIFIFLFLVSLPMNIAQGQYVFTDHYKSFDPNMCSAAEYSPPPSATNSSQESTVITPFHTISSNYNELTNQNSEIALVPASDVPSNCITYNNVIFVPTIANNENQLEQIGDTIELVKHESVVPGVGVNESQSFKYIVSSEPRFVNTFIRATDIDNSTVLNNDSSAAFIDQQSSHMITTVPQINNTNLIVNSISNRDSQIHQHMNNVETIDQNQISVQMQEGNDQEVLMQDENGQLYRQVQNILINGTSMCPSELLPILSAPVDLGDPDYVDNQLQSINRTFHQRENSLHEIPFQIPVNFVGNSEPTDTIPVSSKSIDANLDMQQVEFIFNSYKNTNVNQIDTNQYGTESDAGILNNNTPMQTNTDSVNQQRNLLESTMSTLRKLKCSALKL